MEVIVSAVLIAIVLAGLANLFVAGKRYILHARSRITGGELGRVFLDPLQMQVREDTWNQATNDLTVGTRYCDSDPAHAGLQQQDCPTQAERTLSGIEYSASYAITPHPQDANTRKVVTTINWSETQP